MSNMLDRDDIANALRSHLPGIPVYTYPRYQGPIYATTSAALGYRTLLLVEDSREIPEFANSVRALADQYHGKVRHAAGRLTADFAGGGSLLARTPNGPPVPRRIDQVIVLEREARPVDRVDRMIL